MLTETPHLRNRSYICVGYLVRKNLPLVCDDLLEQSNAGPSRHGHFFSLIPNRTLTRTDRLTLTVTTHSHGVKRLKCFRPLDAHDPEIVDILRVCGIIPRTRAKKRPFDGDASHQRFLVTEENSIGKIQNRC